MLYALGHGDQLVARSHACDFPASALAIPSCTEVKAALPGIGYSLGERLKALVQESLSPHRVDAQLLRDLRPEIIFTRYDLPFAGITAADLEKAVAEWFGTGVRLIPLDIMRISDLWPAFREIAAEMGTPDEGVRIAMQLQQRMAAIVRQAAVCSQRPRVACLSRLSPPSLAGGFMPELIEMAGAKHVPGGTQARSEIAWEDLHAAQADVLLLMLGNENRGREAAAAIENRDEWNSLPAVASGNVALCLGGTLFTRLGPRVADALEAAAEIAHPDEFQFGHCGQSWQPL